MERSAWVTDLLTAFCIICANISFSEGNRCSWVNIINKVMNMLTTHRFSRLRFFKKKSSPSIKCSKCLCSCVHCWCDERQSLSSLAVLTAVTVRSFLLPLFFHIWKLKSSNIDVTMLRVYILSKNVSSNKSAGPIMSPTSSHSTSISSPLGSELLYVRVPTPAAMFDFNSLPISRRRSLFYKNKK